MCIRDRCKPAVQALVDAGIPIINFDSAVADIELVDTFVATDNYKAGQIAAEQMMKDFPDGGKVAVLDYPINTAAVDRANGFIDALKGSNFEVVAQFDASGKPETGLSVTEDILQAHSDLTAIFAINDESGMGAYAAVVASGDDVAIYGVNGNPETKVEIAKADSPYKATAAQSTIGMGQQSIEVAYKILKGEEFPKQIDVAPFIINADNVKDVYKRQHKKPAPQAGLAVFCFFPSHEASKLSIKRQPRRKHDPRRGAVAYRNKMPPHT